MVEKKIDEQGLISPKVRKVQRVKLAKADAKKAFDDVESPSKKKVTGIPFDRFNEELSTVVDPVGAKANS